MNKSERNEAKGCYVLKKSPFLPTNQISEIFNDSFAEFSKIFWAFSILNKMLWS
jgi:hypothetical protein